MIGFHGRAAVATLKPGNVGGVGNNSVRFHGRAAVAT